LTLLRVFPLWALSTVLYAQTWSTFYSAYEDGLEALQRGDHAGALRAFAFAAQKHPEPGARVKTYGLNFMSGYFPYLKQAECALALGDLDRADRALQESARWPQEPAASREGLAQRLRQARAAREAAQKPAPARVEPTPEPVRPAPKPLEAPVKAQETAVKPSEPAPKPQETRPAPADPIKTPPPKPEPQRKEAAPAMPVAAAPTQSAPVVTSESETKVVPPTNEPVAPSTSASSPIPPHWLGLGGGGVLAALGGIWWLSKRRPKPAGGPPTTLTNPYKVDLDTHQKGAATVMSDARKGQAPKSRRVGPYVITKVLGKGGCATTYLAVHEEDGTEVAVKIPHPHIVIDPEFLARFRREAGLGAVLDHPRIVRILDPGPEEGDAWIAMTLVRGTTLDAHLAQRNGHLELPEIIHISSDIAEAIAHAHNKGVVHRDLKPSNVMLGELGAQVMDFGIARVLDTNMTSTTVFIGTPSYAAPESLVNPRVGPPADRYALGIVIFELLAGRLPFVGETTFQVLEMHKSSPLPDLKALRPDTPPRLLRLVERLTAKRPEERPEDGEVLTILAALKTEFPMAT
jgi:outer membrane biosynthesis protein TonB